MHAPHEILFTVGALLAATSPAAAADKLRVQATLVERPRSTACDADLVRVLCRYRLDRPNPALRATSLWVVHRCPELWRGPARVGPGDAPPLKPGHSHLLELIPYRGTIDVVPEAGPPASATLYQALRTDRAPPPPRVAVVVTGVSGAKIRLDFDALTVSVGRRPDSDVFLNDRAVALRQLLLEVRDGRLVVRDLQPGRVKLNGTALRGKPAVTHRDTLTVGPYSLKVSLFRPSEVRGSAL
jgi:hypothetical protein